MSLADVEWANDAEENTRGTGWSCVMGGNEREHGADSVDGWRSVTNSRAHSRRSVSSFGTVV